MRKTGITGQHLVAVSHLARGRTEQQIVQYMGGVNVKPLLKEASDIWRAKSPSALVIRFINSLTPEERAQWKEWASAHYARLKGSNKRQRRQLAMFTVRTTATQSSAELAKQLKVDEGTFSDDLGALLGLLSGIETRAGLVAVCYLVAQGASAPVVAIEDVPYPRLTAMQLEVLRLVGRGLTDVAISIELNRSTRTINTHVCTLLRAFGVKSRTRLAFIYLHRYQPAEERIEWQSEGTFRWPPKDAVRQGEILRFLLTWELCDASYKSLSELLFIADYTLRKYTEVLMNRLKRKGWPRTRQSLMVAAELHRPG